MGNELRIARGTPKIKIMIRKLLAKNKTNLVKRIRNGYWELIPDKILDPGEYVFSAFDPTGGSAKGPGALLFAFGID
jgi:hypothetical protein